MLLTERELATYEGIQQALDTDIDNQMLRLMLADWYEERGREAAAECMRWLATNHVRPYRMCDPYQWAWTRESNDFRKMYTAYRLPDPVHALLDERNGSFDKGDEKYGGYKIPKPYYWWHRCRTRQVAEESAVLAWEQWWRVR